MKTLILALLLATCHAYIVQHPLVSLIEPRGISFSYPAEPGITLVEFHYSINQDLTGVAAGHFNIDVTTKSSGYFITENAGVHISAGDSVYYWINVMKDGAGYILMNQLWTAQDGNVVTDPPDQTSEPTKPPSGSGIVCSSYPCDSSCDTSIPPCNGLIFQENWETFDLARWQHEITMSGGGNWEFQYYTNNRSNSYVRDNTLFIKPTLTSDKYGEAFLSSGTLDLWGGSPADHCTGNSFWGCSRTGTGNNYVNPIQSARIRTVKSFAFKYGRIIVKAKMPQGDWLWPAIWMLPRDNAYGGWPASGEIDIVECRGNTNLTAGNVSKGNDNMGMTLHWGPFWPMNGYSKTTVETHGTFATEFHEYEVEWTENAITFKLDGNVRRTINPPEGFWKLGEFAKDAPGIQNPWELSPNRMAPFDREFYILINVAVGGTNEYFPDSWTNNEYPKPWLNNSPTAFKDFWLQKDKWYPTWKPDTNNGEDASLQVKSIEVWAN